ncbi:hypothetical protein M2360_000529 [Rhizobium sp. SG_E_25_P2]|uniref:hypothetical protein n=1 Tax=Rhizobium sp. SG_E_25_P2 TaxID=2879942 RepID=UPI0024741A42|nr:hypothetical protein [Rhizobium sp. SG_E_25_P2]MDH6265148.1 hypothetical protein [Rhizobium sp. SG_E_25_P2]
MSETPKSRTAEIRALARSDEPRALAQLTALLSELFAISPENLAINHDQYSLNSLNGFFEADGQAYFFKFHQEEGEEAMTGEYYRADILARAGLPVDQPVMMSVLPGEQILVYRRRADPRFSDVLRGLDLSSDANAEIEAVAAEAELNDRLLAVYRETLHPITPDQARAEPINRLFFERMIVPATRQAPGGRYRDFYIDQTFRFPNLALDWEAFSNAQVTVNGQAYRDTFVELFTRATEKLNPIHLAGGGGVVAHGDAHNANVWYVRRADGGASLSFFDPAFAGEHVPALLAEAKATFHNIFAHPFWLYDPADAAQRFSASATYRDGVLSLETDWDLSPVRQALLEIKADRLWRPLLGLLKSRGMLPDGWRETLKLALFLCPTLVMNLRAGAGSHSEISSAIAFSVAMQMGSEPLGEGDRMSRFLDAVTPS